MRIGGRALQALVVAAGLTLAGCAGHRSASPPPLATLPPPPATVAPPAPSVPAASLATIWQLRVALNVAALVCRGPSAAALVGGYNGMLHKRRDLLNAAQGEMAAQYGGVDRPAYDSAMTRLYNVYAQWGLRPAFCPTAVRVQRDEAGVGEAQFGAFAARALVDLNVATPPPVLAMRTASHAPVAATPPKSAPARRRPHRRD